MSSESAVWTVQK